MAKRRRAGAARAGQSQLFPEALQDQRQITMASMLPAESARVSSAEASRVARLLFGETCGALVASPGSMSRTTCKLPPGHDGGAHEGRTPGEWSRRR